MNIYIYRLYSNEKSRHDACFYFWLKKRSLV